jgi:hypothetical protein
MFLLPLCFLGCSAVGGGAKLLPRSQAYPQKLKPCEAENVTEAIASRGNSAGRVIAGGGFTVRLSDSGWKFYVESR